MKTQLLSCPVRENILVISLDESSPNKITEDYFRKSKFFFFLFLFSVVKLQAQVSAGFTVGAPVPNCNPAVYSFTNSSSGISPLTYEWNFGVYPGVNSVFQNPSTTYLNCGAYKVKLVVTNGIGQKDSVTQLINIRCSPNVNFSVSNISGCVPFSTSFTSASTPGSGTITKYLWDFGDGYNSSGVNPTHIYDVSGCKNVTLIVTNSYNCVHDTSISNALCTYQPPVANFTSSNPHSCIVPFTVAYQSTVDSGLTPYSYHWIFPGGTPASSNMANPMVVYSNPGNYTTTLIVSDANGCSDTVVQSGYINIPATTADFSISAFQGCVNSVITANGISSGIPASWKWSVTPSDTISNDTSQNVSFQFANPGNYNVCLDVDYGGGCTAQKCSAVTITAPPTANYSFSGALSTCIKPELVSFTDSSSGNHLSYNWFFPGGTPSVDNTPTPPLVRYDTCGQYSASLIVTDSFGCSTTYSTPDFLTITCPQVSFIASPSIGCTPLTTSFNSASTTGNPVSWQWNFGDTLGGATADTSSAQNPTHTYNYPGCYTVILTVTNAEGCTYSDTIPAAVCNGHKPHANFSGNPPLNCAKMPVYFTDSSTNTYSYTTYVWDFHGGPPYNNESTFQNPTYTYNDTGFKNISLIVSNYGCADTITKDALVDIKGPVAIPKVVPNCGSTTVFLDGTGSYDAQHYSWYTPGGNPSSSNNPTVSVTYPGTGAFTATLSVTNDSTGCSYISPISFNVNGLQAQFTGSPLSGCAPLYSCMSSTSTGVTVYSWEVTDSLGNVMATSAFGSICANLTEAGVYNVRLVVYDATGCSDTLYRPKYIRVSNPKADFNATPVTGCTPLKVNFTDLSSSGNSSISSWNWNFADSVVAVNDTSIKQNPTYIYNIPGIYSVSLTITDDAGCSRNVTKLQYIQVSQLATGFTSTITNTCQGTQACFTSDSVMPGLNYFWNFGDGDTSTAINPCHNYTVPGAYSIQHIVSNNTGCKDSAIIATNIKVARPHAVLVADTTTTTCPPLQVTFSNLSTAITPQTTFNWDFGDGQVSSGHDVTHIYNIAGTFTVTLVATNSNGCSDTLTIPQYINVGGPTAVITQPPSSACVPDYTCITAVSTSTISYTWNYGDGTVSLGNSTTCYNYTRTGTFYPELILNNGTGCVYGMPVGAISVGGSAVAFGVDDSDICINGTVHFADSSAGISPVKSWLWNFGDPSSSAQDSSTLQDPSHFYNTSGNYPVVLRIRTYDGCTDTISKMIKVMSPPAVKISESNPANCSNQAIVFQDKTTSSSPVASRLWNFGDPASGTANISVLQNPVHTYNAVGSYTVMLTEIADNGCVDSNSYNLVVNQSPVAAFAAFDTCVNTQPVLFKNNSQYANYYQWFFGDGNSSAQVNPSNSYSANGVYSALLIAQNNTCNDTFRSPVTVFPLPTALFTISVTDLCGPPFAVNVNNNSKGAIDYQWSLNNKVISTEYTPDLSINNPGNYDLALKVRNTYLCADTMTQMIAAHQKPTALFTAYDTCQNTQPIVFNNNSKFAKYYSWNYGDGNTSFVADPAYTYSSSGKYNVTLITANDYCLDTFSLGVNVYPAPNAAFTLSSNYLCGPSAKLVINNMSSGANSYWWNFGDSVLAYVVNPVITYPVPGNYIISLKAGNSYQCYDSATQPVTAYPNPVINNVNIQQAEGCRPLKINITANATNAYAYQWDFGDQTGVVTSDSSTVTYIYQDTGTYSITLRVLSFKDCGDTLLLADTIKVHITPQADFDYSINTADQPENGTVIFTNKSQNADSYVWNFGDGITSSQISPEHLFQDVNTFNVKLVAENKFGCKDSVLKSVYEVKKTLYVPNAFAPDYVGGNYLVKVWQPVGIGLLKYHAQVFDKWGELLWESTQLTTELSPGEGWDGTYQGKLCQQGVYVWKIEAVFMDGSRWKGMSYDDSVPKTIGSVTLIR